MIDKKEFIEELIQKLADFAKEQEMWQDENLENANDLGHQLREELEDFYE